MKWEVEHFWKLYLIQKNNNALLEIFLFAWKTTYN